jgi:hypothetical protein
MIHTPIQHLNNILTNFKNTVRDKGIVFPLLRDNGVPSTSFTLLISSFIMWCLGITEVIKNMDIDKAENMVMVCASLYFGRKLTKDNTNKLTINQPPNGEKETQ